MFNIFKKPKWPDFPFDEILKRARLLVIDDQEFYYLDLFKKDGYQIEKWNDIDDLPKLEKGYYDIILLDLQGVGREQSQDQGFGILKHLRKKCPTQIIIAYSNADWSVKYHDFFKLADSVLVKTQDYVDFKMTVDVLLTQRFSIGFYVGRIIELIEPYTSDLEKVREVTQESILKNSPTKLESLLEKIVDNKDVIAMALHIVQVAVVVSQSA